MSSSHEAIYDPAVYSEEYYARNYLPRVERLRAFFGKQLDRVSRQAPGKQVLDVGFGVGAFLVEAVARGWKASGIEASRSAYEEASKLLSGKAQLRLGEFLEMEENAEMSLITFWDVLAHVPDPRAYIEKARDGLRVGGLMMVKTPLRSNGFFSILRWVPTGMRRSLIHWPMQIFHFNQKCLETIFDRVGLTVQEIQIIEEPPAPSPRWPSLLIHPRGLLYHLAHRTLRLLFPPSSLIVTAQRTATAPR